MGYGAVIVTRLILRDLNQALVWVGVVVTAFTSACEMTLLDLASDPIASTLLGKWTWGDGGSYFGVPVHNYIGWVATTFTFFLIITIFAQPGRCCGAALGAGLVITVSIIAAAVSVWESSDHSPQVLASCSIRSNIAADGVTDPEA
jgi:uncharacterized membrane protein